MRSVNSKRLHTGVYKFIFQRLETEKSNKSNSRRLETAKSVLIKRWRSLNFGNWLCLETHKRDWKLRNLTKSEFQISDLKRRRILNSRKCGNTEICFETLRIFQERESGKSNWKQLEIYILKWSSHGHLIRMRPGWLNKKDTVGNWKTTQVSLELKVIMAKNGIWKCLLLIHLGAYDLYLHFPKGGFVYWRKKETNRIAEYEKRIDEW